MTAPPAGGGGTLPPAGGGGTLPPAPRRTSIRTRLTLLYGGMFFLAGATLVLASYLLVSATLTERLGTISTAPVLTSEIATPGVPYGAAQVQAAIAAGSLAVRDDTLRSLLALSLVALAVTGVLAVGSGWVMAGRVLNPLSRITATARRVADRSLHERIALQGPPDELRELADTFDAMLERLDRAFDGQRRFVADASHELRTPLAINRTLIEVAATRPGAPEDLRRLGETLLAVNARHERLIDGLLVLARSEHELTERADVDLADIAAIVVDGRDGDAVELRLDARPAPTAGDPLLLERLVANLVDNAVRYNRPGGWVRVCTGVDRDVAWLRVVNPGHVVAAHSVPAMFAPFHRAEARTATGGGSGLGLSIARSVATAHGGTVTAQPRDGGGLTVRVALPVRSGGLGPARVR